MKNRPSDTERARVEDALARGRVRFLGLDLAVAPGALVPRAETELLARAAIAALLGAGARNHCVVDMCCGAGNLACAIARHVEGARVWASDLTDACVALARANAAALGLSDRVSVHQGDLFASLRDLENRVDMVVCNPPYISEKRLATERRELLELEPQEAFDAGPYGLGIHQRVIRDASRFLKPGGLLLFEIGAGQRGQVETLLRRAREYEAIDAICDDAGEARVVRARRRTSDPQQEKLVD